MCIDKETGKTTLKFKEMISSGRTGTMSATGFMGVISGILALCIIFALIIFYFTKPAEAINILELIDRIIVIFSISAGLLGVRKISGVLGNKQFSAGEIEQPQSNSNNYNNNSRTYINNTNTNNSTIRNKLNE